MSTESVLANLDADCSQDELRETILGLTEEYARRFHAPKPFIPGESAVPVSGKVYGPNDMRLLVDSALDFWLTTGRFNDAFEARLAKRLDVAHCLTTNSGSSANLLALSSLTSHYLRADGRGDPVHGCDASGLARLAHSAYLRRDPNR